MGDVIRGHVTKALPTTDFGNRPTALL